jgi:hypothetical protein
MFGESTPLRELKPGHRLMPASERRNEELAGASRDSGKRSSSPRHRAREDRGGRTVAKRGTNGRTFKVN